MDKQENVYLNATICASAAVTTSYEKLTSYTLVRFFVYLLRSPCQCSSSVIYGLDTLFSERDSIAFSAPLRSPICLYSAPHPHSLAFIQGPREGNPPFLSTCLLLRTPELSLSVSHHICPHYPFYSFAFVFSSMSCRHVHSFTPTFLQ